MPPSLDKMQRLLRMTTERRFGQRPNEGQRGALEMLRDWAPATFEVNRPENIVSPLLRNYERLAITTPSRFLDLAAPLSMTERSRNQISVLEQMLRERQSLPDAYGMEYHVNEHPKFRGFGDMPFLQVMDQDELPFARIRGHEGRHRMYAIGNIYGENTPVGVRLTGYEPEELRAASDLPWVMNETQSKIKGLYEDPGIFLKPTPRPLYSVGGSV